MKLTTPKVSAPTDVPAGTIGVAVQTERAESHTLGGIPCWMPSTVCYAVFPGQPLTPLGQQELPKHQRPTRKLATLHPNQKVRINVRRPLGSIGNYVFENKEGRLYVRRAWLPWSRRRLEMDRTGECNISSLV